MATRLLNLVLSTSLLVSLAAMFPVTTKSDDTCPYPCYPPPTGTGTPTPPATTTPSPPSQGSGSYPPSLNYPPPAPAGYLPYYSPPPNGNNYGVSPPPPDPILPYFPYYYKKPLHQTDDQSNSAITGLQRSKDMIVLIKLLAFLSVFFFLM